MRGSNLGMRRKRLYIPVTQFTGLQNAAPTISIGGGVAPAANTTVGIVADSNGSSLTKTSAGNVTGITGVQAPDIVTAGTNNPPLVEIGTTGLVALKTNTQNDDISHLMPIPWDLDRHQATRARVWWACESVTAADTILWAVLYKVLTAGTTAIAAPATALDTVINAATLGTTTAKVIQASSWGIINAGKIVNTANLIGLLVKLSNFAAGLTEDKYLLGLELEYTRRTANTPRNQLPGKSIVEV